MDTATGRRRGRGLIIVRLRGGLGNQLFQYALGRHLSIIHDRPLLLDTSEYGATRPDPKRGIRVYGLHHFMIRAEVAGPDETEPFRCYYRQDLLSRVLRRAGGVGFLFGHTYHYRTFRQAHIFYPRVLSGRPRRVWYLDGYWQAERYFAPIETILREELVLREPPNDYNRRMLELIGAAESVCVHVRHGDNANQAAAQHGILPPDYYRKAVEDLVRAVPNPASSFFPTTLNGPGKTCARAATPSMSTATTTRGTTKTWAHGKLPAPHHGQQHLQLVGAWLGRRAGQRVYAPGRYFMHLDVPNGDYYPKSWNIIDV